MGFLIADEVESEELVAEAESEGGGEKKVDMEEEREAGESRGEGRVGEDFDGSEGGGETWEERLEPMIQSRPF